MIIIGEKINATRKSINTALTNRDINFLQKVAINQEKMGANYLDLNCGSGENEENTMEWLVDVVQEVVNIPLCIDSSSTSVILSGLKKCKKSSECIANSLTYEKERIEEVIHTVKEHNCYLICLLMDEEGIPKTAQRRVKVAEKFVKLFEKHKITHHKIFFDPLVEPVSLDTQKGLLVLETISLLKEKFPEIKVVVSLSGISFGLPNRNLLNRNFIPLLISKGCEAIILDPTENDIVPTVYASNLLLDKDDFCMQYIQYIREGL